MWQPGHLTHVFFSAEEINIFWDMMLLLTWYLFTDFSEGRAVYTFKVASTFF
jgi:hypothetical protein